MSNKYLIKFLKERINLFFKKKIDKVKNFQILVLYLKKLLKKNLKKKKKKVYANYKRIWWLLLNKYVVNKFVNDSCELHKN